MDSTPTTDPPTSQADRAFEKNLREMNEALLISSVRQHELAEQAQKAERTLAKALAYGDDIIATLREPFLVLDQNLRVKTANRSFYDSFHVSKEETENHLVYDLGNGQWDIPALRKLLDEVLSRNQSIHDFEVEHSFPTLGRKTMLLNARPFPPDSKHPELILLAVYDVSAVRARAEELADLHHRKDEFLAMLSHELRNPLAPIANAVQLLGLRETEDKIQQKACTIIERQVAQLTRLVDELMEVSRFNTGRVQLRRERILVSDIVKHALETAHPLLEQHRHELTLSLAPHPIWLDADSARLEQVVVNLLTNAAKYTSDGGHIWLTAGQEGPDCVVRVRDTGVGIAPDLLPHVFDLFTQASRTLARSQGGLGIGLALVKKLTELHGGTVEAYSAPGQGSEFVVRLPVAEPDTLQPASSVMEAGQPTIRPLRMLVVDDDVDAAEMLEMLLTISGHAVRIAHDGPAALEAALEFRPNVVLLDIGLPEMDGYEVAKRIRQQPALTNVVLVALTGYGQETIRQRSQDAGFDHHLVKPADFAKVQHILATVSQSEKR